MDTPPDPLDPLLNRWADSPEPSSRLTSEVWRRIAAAESERPARTGWAALDPWFARPAFTALFVVCCALLGLFLAEVRVNREQRHRNAELARTYLQLIDPLLDGEKYARNP